MRRTVITAILSVPLMALGAPLASAAAPVGPGPQRLTASQLDSVTAGTLLSALAAATSTGGSFALTEAGAAGVTEQTSTPGGTVQRGVVGAVASAIGPGANNTLTMTSGSVSVPLINQTVTGSLSAPGGQASFSMTYVSGGAYFMP